MSTDYEILKFKDENGHDVTFSIHEGSSELSAQLDIDCHSMEEAEKVECILPDEDMGGIGYSLCSRRGVTTAALKEAVRRLQNLIDIYPDTN